MAQALGRVVDTSALDSCAEPRGRHAIVVPVEWVGAEILIAVPTRIVCARCDGGGCDGCRRRGGHRIDGDAEARAIRVRLPRSMEGVVVLRIVRPFGHAEGAIAQLHVEARVGPGASGGVVLCALATPDPAPPVARAAPRVAPRVASPSNHVSWAVAAFFAVGILVAVAMMR